MANRKEEIYWFKHPPTGRFYLTTRRLVGMKALLDILNNDDSLPEEIEPKLRDKALRVISSCRNTISDLMRNGGVVSRRGNILQEGLDPRHLPIGVGYRLIREQVVSMHAGEARRVNLELEQDTQHFHGLVEIILVNRGTDGFITHQVGLEGRLEGFGIRRSFGCHPLNPLVECLSEYAQRCLNSHSQPLITGRTLAQQTIGELSIQAEKEWREKNEPDRLSTLAQREYTGDLYLERLWME